MRTVAPLVLLLLACNPALVESTEQRTGPPSATTTSGSSTIPTPTATTTTAPNLLIVMVDDVGLDQINSLYEVPFDISPATTPTIDSLAAQGIVFDNAYAAPTCSPTRSAIMSGLLPRNSGIATAIMPGEDLVFTADSYQSLPELLREEAGYYTALAGKWHLSPSQSDCASTIEHGYDWFAGTMFNFSESTSTNASQSYLDWEKCVDGSLVMQTTYATTDTVDDAIDQLQTMPEPWMMMVSFNAPHDPLHTPPDEALYQISDIVTADDEYTAMLEAVDTELGRLLDEVDDQDTHIWFLADNGSPHNRMDVPGFDRPGKGTLLEGGIRVPMIVTGPGLPQGVRTDALTTVLDIFPTALELAGVHEPDWSGDGVSIAGVLTDPNATGPHDRVFWEKFEPNGVGGAKYFWRRTLRDDRYKMMIDVIAGQDERVELFDLQVDGGWSLNDLMLLGPLDTDAQEAHDRLYAELQAEYPVDVVTTP